MGHVDYFPANFFVFPQQFLDYIFYIRFGLQTLLNVAALNNAMAPSSI